MIYTALIGFPTKHSVSPLLFSIYAEACKLDYSHLKIDVKPESQNLSEIVSALNVLDFSGFNITIPYKYDIIPLLDEVDTFASQIGAVNTAYRQNGKLFGCNTDAFGAIQSIKSALKRPIARDDNIIIFGTGGASKALIGGLMNTCGNIAVVYRTPRSSRTKDLAERFKNRIELITYDSPHLREKLDEAMVICNATPVGMLPKQNGCILTDTFFTSSNNPKVFFDVVYNPFITQFLKKAAESGHLIADGLNMMIYQGVKAFELWTEKKVPEEAILKARETLKKTL